MAHLLENAPHSSGHQTILCINSTDIEQSLVTTNNYLIEINHSDMSSSLGRYCSDSLTHFGGKLKTN